jgi:RNA polymerase sigma factor (sigma-70 family)
VLDFFKHKSADYTNEEIVRGIIDNSNDVLRFVYRKYSIEIKIMVYTFRNMALDPEEVFQEGLTRAIINIREGRFRGESAFSTYLNAICRNICLKQMSHNAKGENIENDIEDVGDSEKFELLDAILTVRDRLNDRCREVIGLRFKLDDVPGDNPKNTLLPFEEVAEALNTSADNARQRFKRCFETLKGMVQQDETVNAYFA